MERLVAGAAFADPDRIDGHGRHPQRREPRQRGQGDGGDDGECGKAGESSRRTGGARVRGQGCAGGQRDPARDHGPHQRRSQQPGLDQHARQMADDHRQEQPHQDLVDILGAMPECVAGNAGQRPLLLLAALNQEAGDDERCQHAEQCQDHHRAGRVMAEMVQRAEQQEAAQMLGQPAGGPHHAGDPAVFGAEQTPDQPKHQQHDDQIAGGEMDTHPGFGRHEPGQQGRGDRRDQQPVEQPRRQVPDIDQSPGSRGRRGGIAAVRRQLMAVEHVHRESHPPANIRAGHSALIWSNQAEP